MQRCLIYEKTMAAEARNGGSSHNNSNGKDHSRRKLLVGVDLFCLFLGKTRSPTAAESLGSESGVK